MNRWTTSLLCCGIALGVSHANLGVAQADITPEQTFKSLDKNGDGILTAEEAGKDNRSFNRLVRVGDKNADGKLSKEEFIGALNEKPAEVTAPPGQRPEQARQFNPAQIFQRLDRNGDGKLTKEELPEEARGRFQAVFTRLNKEELTLEEFEEAARRAQQPGGQRGGNPAEFFKRLDANNDGKITLAEVPERAKPIVTQLLKESNKGEDGSLSVEEFGKAMAARMRNNPNQVRPNQTDRPQPGRLAIIQKLDTNNDGKLSKDELAKLGEKFNELDTDNDGNLDARELAGGAGRPEMARPNATDRPQNPQQAGQFLERMINQFDKNNDGQISKEEAPERMKARFDRIDANGDGQVDRKELERMAARMNRAGQPERKRPQDGQPENQPKNSRPKQPE